MWNHREDDDYYSQPGDLWRLLPEDEKGRLIDNVVESFEDVPDDIRKKAVDMFSKADKDCGRRLAKAIGM